MNMVIPDTGKQEWTDGLASWLANEDPTLEVRLFKNNLTPSDTTVLGDFVEATFPGYAAISVVNADWVGGTLTGHVAYLEYTTPPSFTCTAGGPETVYGWYLVDTVAGVVLATQRFNTPAVMNPSANILLDPFQIGLQTLH